MYKILLVEDDNILCEMIKEYFTENNYYINYCNSHDEALKMINEKNYDLFLLDIKIEKGNGFDLLKQIREQNINTPAIFTTSLNSIIDLERGFNIGCNDYLKKPYDLKELLIRANLLITQCKNNSKTKENISNDYIFDYESMLLYKNNNLINLSKKETKLLNLFLLNKNKLLSNSEIFEELWDLEEPSFLSLRTYIKNIRKILGKENIINKKDEGYIFVK
ncbi:response regulator transcription factor [Aliarcobacter butzleri]|uniref:response regulator transcription factor n=1 Tax=Aliarcobacter butzleri TaxID=28197 RepID=UPI00263D4750|nr:response regulator transcription factor [Aliarcobacter butzleri]MDN5043289.1 response regulator transcription factor [Aliarcobacter butzleri]